MRLYHHPISGHSHRVLLFLALLKEPVELIEVDILCGEQKTKEFLELNKFGQVPVLDDDGIVVADSNSILVYLAMKLKRHDWLPADPLRAAEVQRWLSVAAGELAYGPAAARRIKLVGDRAVSDEIMRRSQALLAVLDNELGSLDWLVADRPTLADVALYSYVARAPEGNIDLTDYPYVQAWL